MRKEFQAVFDERYNKELTENTFARESAMWEGAGLYIRRICTYQCILLVSGHNDRASDVALKALCDYCSKFTPESHVYFIASASTIAKHESYNKRLICKILGPCYQPDHLYVNKCKC